jgi:tagaturonate reductase
MHLSKHIIEQLQGRDNISVPEMQVFDLPEKVLQFGTGVLLRALPDYFIDKANKQGIFNGRVVVVKSTESDSSAFDRQDGLYTVCIRGAEQDRLIEENIINASISRVLSAKNQWQQILDCAKNPEMKIIFSNTTEVGIQLVDDDVHAAPPISFPGKLLAFLYHRFLAFNGSAESGMIIVPTELITDNGSRLESIVLELAHRNGLDYKFIEWLENHNRFCNSLVDRIVTGKPDAARYKEIAAQLGYDDELMTASEPFRLWAIEGDEVVKQVLSFCRVDEGVIIEPDITLHKELKLRLLNGTHTFNCGLAFLCGFTITREAITHPLFSAFARQLMHEEIAPAIPYAIDAQVKTDYANRVFNRFCNPFIDHQWQSITTQYTSKMNMRNVPLLVQHYKNNNHAPGHMVTAFAAYLLYMKAIRTENGRYWGERNGEAYEINDDAAGIFYEAWQQYNTHELVTNILGHKNLWNADLAALPGFTNAVQEALEAIITTGPINVIAQLQQKPVIA